MVKGIKLFMGAVVAMSLVAGGAVIAHGEEFYKGKTIFFIVGYSPGGSFDAYTRLIARHFAKHVPGKPTTIVQNMTGAGGIIAANYIYNIAKPDGLTVGAFAGALVLQQVLGSKAIKLDGRKLGWLGVPAPYSTICYVSSAIGINTVDDWFAFKRPVKFGAIGPGTTTSDVPKLIKAAIGLPLRVLEGYRGGAKVRLALESGEIEGYCSSWQTIKSISKTALDSGKIRLLVQATLKPHPELKHIPLAINYAKTPAARQLLEVADSFHAPFKYSVPPGTPGDRLQILQKAFMAALRDPELLSEAKKSRLEIDPTDGPTTAEEVDSLYRLDSTIISKLQEILLPKKR